MHLLLFVYQCMDKGDKEKNAFIAICISKTIATCVDK